MRARPAAVAATLGLAATLGGTLAKDAEAARGWRASRGGFAHYGLVSETCDSDGHATACLALACRWGQIELASAAGGGGPMEGRTTIRFGGRTLRTTFVLDPRAVDVMGLAASRSRISGKALEAMAAAGAIELSAPNSGVVMVHRFPTRNLAVEVTRAAAACARRGTQRS